MQLQDENETIRLEGTKVAQVRAPMPASRRAKQFSMFDALKGFKEALAAQERQPEPRRELAQDAIEELNRTISGLKVGEVVIVTYYCHYGKEYRQLTGPVEKVSAHWGFLQVGNACIDFREILQIIK